VLLMSSSKACCHCQPRVASVVIAIHDDLGDIGPAWRNRRTTDLKGWVPVRLPTKRNVTPARPGTGYRGAIRLPGRQETGLRAAVFVSPCPKNTAHPQVFSGGYSGRAGVVCAWREVFRRGPAVSCRILSCSLNRLGRRGASAARRPERAADNDKGGTGSS
jgi:hypothetical protein